MNQDIVTYIANPPSGIMDGVRLLNIHHLLSRVVLTRVPGDVVELGCFSGTTAILMEKTLQVLGSKKDLHLFDSFAGLTDFCERDTLTSEVRDRAGRIYGPGGTYRQVHSYRTTRATLIANFETHRARVPQIVEGYFCDTLANQLPHCICFAHLDSDLYQPLKLSLEQVVPRLSPGAIVVVDDYDATGGIYPGCRAAVDEFFSARGLSVINCDFSFIAPFARQAVYINELGLPQ